MTPPHFNAPSSDTAPNHAYLAKSKDHKSHQA